MSSGTSSLSYQCTTTYRTIRLFDTPEFNDIYQTGSDSEIAEMIASGLSGSGLILSGLLERGASTESSSLGQSQNVNALADLYYFG